MILRFFGTSKWYHNFLWVGWKEIYPSGYNNNPNQIFFNNTLICRNYFFSLLLYRQKAYSVDLTARIRKQSTCLKICIPLKVVHGSFPSWQCLKWTSIVRLILSAFYFNLHPLFTLRGTSICRALICSETMSWNDRADHLDLFRLGSWGSEISIPLPVFRDQSYLLLPDSNIFPLDNGRHNRSISIFFHFFSEKYSH